MTRAGSPHSDTLGSQPASRLPEAYRRPPRPSSAPDAKASTERPKKQTQHPAKHKEQRYSRPLYRSQPTRPPRRPPAQPHQQAPHRPHRAHRPRTRQHAPTPTQDAGTGTPTPNTNQEKERGDQSVLPAPPQGTLGTRHHTGARPRQPSPSPTYSPELSLERR